MAHNAHWNDAPISRALREQVKAALCAHPTWETYREAVSRSRNADFHTGNMTKRELVEACDALGVSIDALVERLRETGATAAPPAAPVDVVAPDAAPVDVVAPDAAPVDVVAPDAAPVDAAPAMSRFEGRDADDIVGDVLGPIAAALSPAILQQVHALATAAAQGPRTITTTLRVNTNPDAEPLPMPVVRSNRPARAFFGLGAREGGQAWARVLNGIALDVYDFADAPRVDPDYIWTPETAATFAACAVDGAPLFLTGPAGTGKSEGARQFAALGKRAFSRIAIHRTTEPADLIGQYLPKQGGGFTWRDGPLTRAFRIPGCVILIDEPSFLRPGSLAVFQTALDFGSIYLPTGEVVDRAPGVFVVAADNTNGSGDATGRYADTGAMSLALIDRFRVMHVCDYLPAPRETDLIVARCNVDRRIAEHLVSFATKTREGSNDGKLTAGLTTRRVMAWANNVRNGVPSATAFAWAVTNSADPADLETFRMLERTQGGHDMIDAIAAGETWPRPDVTADAQTQTPAGEKAASMFENAPIF